MHAVFFDMDGTLIDSRADLAAAVNAMRIELGLAPITLAAVIACVGNGARYLLEHAIPEAKGQWDEIAPRYREHYQAHMLDKTTLYPGVTETLVELKRRGWQLGVNTNKPGVATRKILAHFGILPLFGEAIIGGGDCPELKPSGRPMVDCAARMNHTLDAQDWMVGDNWTDLASAAACGIQSAYCAFGFGVRGTEPCSVTINQFKDLLDYLVA